jgi:hypothetical protein
VVQLLRSDQAASRRQKLLRTVAWLSGYAYKTMLFFRWLARIQGIRTSLLTTRRRSFTWGLACWLVLVLMGVAGASELPWTEVSNKDGVLVERRAVEGSKFSEYRATTVTTASPEAIVAGIWSGVTEQMPATVKSRQIVLKSDTEIVFYDQIKTKIVSDRDYTARIWKERDPATGALLVRFRTENERRPEPTPGFVRLPTIRGLWTILPDGQGGSRLVYTCFSEPGGSIPAFLVRGPQQEQVMVDIRRILARAQQAKK